MTLNFSSLLTLRFTQRVTTFVLRSGIIVEIKNYVLVTFISLMKVNIFIYPGVA